MEENETQKLKDEILLLKEEMRKRENNFSEKRAQFKDLYFKKEKELEILKGKSSDLVSELKKVKNELLGVQSAAALTESLRKEELDSMKQKYNEEIYRIHGIMKDNIDSISKSKQELENNIKDLELEKSNLIRKLDEKNNELVNSNENVLVKIAQRLKLSTHDIFKGFQEYSEENAEENFSKTSNHTDALKSVVEPYEEDVKMLKNKIREAYEKIDQLEAAVADAKLVDMDTLQKQIVDLQSQLKVEKENNNFLNKTFTEINNKYMETEHKLLRNEQMQSMKENNSCVQTSPNLDDSNCHDNDIKSSLRKSLSGSNISESDANPNTARRNTDVQSLTEYRVKSVVDGSRTSRVVGESEWSRLQLELASLKNRSGGFCEMCKNYEDQLQSVQSQLQEKEKSFNDLSRENQTYLMLITSLQEASNKLSCRLNDDVANNEKSVNSLSDKLNNLESFCERLQSAYERFRDVTDKELKHINNERREMKLKIEKVELAYENLLCKRAKKAREMEAEAIELPSDIESAQFALLKLREELIESRASNEHLSETIQSAEIFSKEREKADKAERDAFINEYNSEKKELEIQIEKLQSELNKRKTMLKSSENLEELNRQYKSELEIHKKNLTSLEIENKSLKSKSHSLQLELENSESVQQDFVRLSQTLQIQLEKIRQEEKELRWQFKEDVAHCNDCQNDLTGAGDRNKYHCKHCGRIFCKNCLLEIVAGSKSKKAEVCKVCHTLLVKEAVPYFSMNKS